MADFNKVKYDNDYQKRNYDRIALNVKKGEKELIMNRAKERGYENITEYLKSLIKADMKNECSGGVSDRGREEVKRFGKTKPES